MATLVLTVVGDDRPGLVDALSGVIAAHDGNWEQSRMAHLAQKFAGILLVQVPDAFDLKRRCVVVTAASGSRGVYGAIAVAGAWGLSRIMEGLLYQVTPTDPLTFLAVSGLLLGTALAACWIPAVRCSSA